MSNDDPSLSDQHTFNAGSHGHDDSPQSLGDQRTFSGGLEDPPQSLGDEQTLGGVGQVDAVFDDDMEIVDLSARYTIEGVLGKGGMSMSRTFSLNDGYPAPENQRKKLLND